MSKKHPVGFDKIFMEVLSAVFESYQKHRTLIVLNLAGVLVALAILTVVGWAKFDSSLYFYGDLNIVDGRFGAGAMTVFSGMCLFISGALFITGARMQYLSRSVNQSSDGNYWWWLIAGAGLVYLGFDEIVMIHEYLTMKLAQFGVPKPFGIDQDLYIFAGYAFVACVVGIKLIPSIIRHRNAVFPLAALIVFFAASEVIDMIPWDSLSGFQKSIFGPAEEILKTMGSWSAVLYAELLLEDVMTSASAHFRQESS